MAAKESSCRSCAAAVGATGFVAEGSLTDDAVKQRDTRPNSDRVLRETGRLELLDGDARKRHPGVWHDRRGCR
jgi:hypothetical protein